MTLLKNIGNAKSPVNLGQGAWAYKHKGRWWLCNSKTKPRANQKFVQVSDEELKLEIEKRGLAVLYPVHECVDRPNLVCPACARDALRALGLLKVCG